MTYRYYIYRGHAAVRLCLDADGDPDRAEVWDRDRFRVDDSFLPDLIMGANAVEVDADQFVDWIAKREAGKLLKREIEEPGEPPVWPWARKEMH